MSFSEHLKGIADGLDGLMGVAIADMDGIIVEEYSVDSGLDMAVFVAEYSPLWTSAEKAGSSMNFDPPDEMNLLHETTAVIARKINPEYFLIMGMESRKGIGKGRYLATLAVAAIEKEL
ncbi:MAG: roadblock/LC7 domain-containing protein [Nitrospiria bacterium]